MNRDDDGFDVYKYVYGIQFCRPKSDEEIKNMDVNESGTYDANTTHIQMIWRWMLMIPMDDAVVDDDVVDADDDDGNQTFLHNGYAVPYVI